MKHFSLYCVPQEEARDLLEQLHKYQAAQGSLEDESKLQCRVTELEVCVCVCVCVSVEQILEEEMFTLCLIGDTV
jgi:hypothetical protein